MSIGLIGDIALNGLISEQGNIKERFSVVSLLLNDFDFVFANLETPVSTGETLNVRSKILLKSDYSITKEVLQYLNIKCVSLANNHIFDAKLSGLKKTIELLDEIGIKHTGAGWEQKHIEPVIVHNKDVRIGFMAYVDKSTHPGTEKASNLFINYFELDTVINDINKLKESVDKIILSVHWGKDYSNFYLNRQAKAARLIFDSGVDIIMGHHPHTLQGYDEYKNKLAFYSLGQLCFGDFVLDGKLSSLRRKTKTGMVVQLEDDLVLSKLIGTKELKGNYIKILKTDISKRIHKYKYLNDLVLKYKPLATMLRFKEAFLDRLYEYFFGYYRNPFKQFFSFNNFGKIRFLIRDFKS